MLHMRLQSSATHCGVEKARTAARCADGGFRHAQGRVVGSGGLSQIWRLCCGVSKLGLFRLGCHFGRNAAMLSPSRRRSFALSVTSALSGQVTRRLPIASVVNEPRSAPEMQRTIVQLKTI